MHKNAADSPWYIFVPGHRPLLGKDPDIKRLPKLTGHADADATIWSTLGMTLTLGTVAAAATVLANKVAEKAWDRKRQEIHKNKVNALYSYNAPNSAPEVAAVDEVREIGLNEPKKLENKASKLLENKEALVEKSAAGGFAAALIPPLVAVPAAFAIGNATSKIMEEDREQTLDKEIAELRNKLDRLYARHLELQGVNKQASGRPNPLGQALTIGALVPLAISGLTGYAAYLYTKKKDENRQKLKMLEEVVMPQNLTNTPAELQLVLGENQALPTRREEQTYIDDLKEKAARL